MTAVLEIARICHEANRLYCQSLGDYSQPTWHDAPDWQKDSAIKGVEFHLAGEHGPEASHESWLKQKRLEGWTWGPEKDVERKTHPCFRPYNELPMEQRRKDLLFLNIVNAFKMDP